MRALPPAASQIQIVKERLTAVTKFFMEELFKTFKKSGAGIHRVPFNFLGLCGLHRPAFLSIYIL